ncbi:MAG TPA: glycosyltransferase [Gemmatimonadales bacterium]|nr:glycosyltransferase [Gemmatimonadales bacterium]
MTLTPYVLLAVSLGLCLYPYLGYPAILKLLRLFRRSPWSPRSPASADQWGAWPSVSITIPVYNAGDVLARTLECILQLDYPPERRQILVVSDASTDSSDEIAAGLAGRGVELLRLPRRAGKTAGENTARTVLRGEIIVNTDASVQIHPQALKALVAALGDPTVGLASGRDVSVARVAARANLGESAYVDYEMRIRDLETHVSGIVGASGCLYAVRAELHREAVREDLSRDFAAVLIARRRGLRAVSVPDAICFVPRGASLKQEYRRKVRTMTRGLRTLWEMRALLNPVRYGLFAWMLLSHKLCRWVVPWAGLGALGALAALAPHELWARGALGAAAAVAGLAVVGWLWPGERNLPRLFALPAYGVGGTVAGLHAWLLAVGGAHMATWEPTRRATAGAR